MRAKPSLFLPCVLMVVSGVAVAQTAPAPPPTETAPPLPARPGNCTPMRPAPRSGTAVPEGMTTGQNAEPLADKLAKSDGVLCPPPGVDPEMRKPAPDAGTTPVIPPPGSPGGSPSIRPE
ncbi:hypothetical protein [Bradyrhizobium sp.]|uniref:hypothetical protein n=1 Tax=Bradyrhizobium sp. TaxID=376 RepID=UPI003C7779D5